MLYQLTPHQLLVRHPMRRICIRALPPTQVSIVFFEIPLGTAGVAVLL
jgi:hypothetical protein